jgi:hypothetical protein
VPVFANTFPLGETAMRLLNRSIKIIVFQFDQPMVVISAALANAAKESVVLGDKIQIKIQPRFFDPFVGRGMIEFTLSSVDNGSKTKAICSIIPTAPPQSGLYVLASALVLWTISALFISLSFTSILMIVCGWTCMAFIIYFTKVLNEGKLENYLKSITATIKR